MEKTDAYIPLSAGKSVMRFDQSTATCQVFTYKEGLFSALAHDLRINVTSFVVDLDEEYMIQASFDTRSLHVDCAMVDGEARYDLLSETSRREIDENILKDVLDSATYGEISFSSASVSKENSAYLVKGSLTMHGNSRELTFTVHEKEDTRIAEILLHLPDFGIVPFSALFGAIKIKPDVLIQVVIPGKKR